ncbi:tripartite tricarboxylate transporter substrate binding protein [Cupriavidus sp. AU9028]|uniref:tripartite tricarboxylate transporter substrate binding protein n=1 Tax=Cupriavidus sp. AU9028 TaxID=2871157 RepID=UPI001C972FD6|nr:tripartite tricarboxylate transporter substrate binding protein [Cupriavidus sp. AU9028]MBY4896502.1 tripartite tricarboxylate transporter substrate binding protein [Cupriavidus sp. AU9028]
MRFNLLGAMMASLTLITAAASAHAADWPTKPVRIIVPYAPGGIADISARATAQQLQAITGQTFIVDNRPGADTRIGTEYVAKQPADGYTLLLAGGGFAVNNSLFDKLPYDTAKDFEPVAMVVSNPLLLVIGSVQPIKTVADLKAAAGKDKGVTLASGGKGTLSHMSMELFASATKLPISHVPYRGGSAHTADVVSGLVTGIFENPSSALPMIEAGKYRAIAVTSAQRNPAFPQVPTMQEAGTPNFDVINWFGLFLPAGVPADTAEKIRGAVAQALANPQLKQRFAKEGVTVGGPAGKAFGKFVADETRRWGDIIRARGIRAD